MSYLRKLANLRNIKHIITLALGLVVLKTSYGAMLLQAFFTLLILVFYGGVAFIVGTILIKALELGFSYLTKLTVNSYQPLRDK